MNWKRFAVFMLPLFVFLLFAGQVWSQTTIANGSIQGTVTDPAGAAIPNAKIFITNTDTQQKLEMKASSNGTYSSGPLIPGSYIVRVESSNFKTSELPVTVQVGVTSAGNVQMEIGSASTVVEVTGNAVQVNTEQAIVQGVVTQDQIENLPVNGRNFLDLA